jgi:hypothetical protein
MAGLRDSDCCCEATEADTDDGDAESGFLSSVALPVGDVLMGRLAERRWEEKWKERDEETMIAR